jgi:hypothetical protein
MIAGLVQESPRPRRYGSSARLRRGEEWSVPSIDQEPALARGTRPSLFIMSGAGVELKEIPRVRVLSGFE